MEMAQAVAKRSTCLRREVGCVLLNFRGHAIATGYNGVATGLPHCNFDNGAAMTTTVKAATRLIDKVLTFQTALDITQQAVLYPHACLGFNSPSGTNLDACEAVHAEQNALLQCRDVYEINKCVVTTAPCVTCTKLLLNTSCYTILFLEEYPHPAARELWLKARRQWKQYEPTAIQGS